MKNLNKQSIYKNRINAFLLVMAIFSLTLGLVLMGINLYGLTQSIRMPGLGVTDHDQLRFIPDEVKSYGESIQAIDDLSGLKQDSTVVEKANQIVHQSLVHVDWNRVDPVTYRLLVPVWENYFLYLLGKFSNLPQFQRYHYADYQRSIRRGIGVCGDASISLSSILDRLNISNKIVSFDGHVIVEYSTDEIKRHLMDPDFGVSLDLTIEELIENPQRVQASYLNAGYTRGEIDYLIKTFKTDYSLFDNTYHFMSKRYIFERVSYVMKWLLPLLLIVISIIYINKFRSIKTQKNEME